MCDSGKVIQCHGFPLFLCTFHPSVDPGCAGRRWRVGSQAPLSSRPPGPGESIATNEMSRQARRGKPRPMTQNFPHTQQAQQG